MPPMTTKSATGLCFRKDLAENECGECSKPDPERSRIGLAEMSKEVATVLPKVAMRAVKPEQLRQLRAGEKQSHPTLEAHHDAFGNKVHDCTSSYRPRNKCNDRDKDGRARRKRAKAGGITAGDIG
jgi:hypothetical protein